MIAEASTRPDASDDNHAEWAAGSSLDGLPVVVEPTAKSNGTDGSDETGSPGQPGFGAVPEAVITAVTDPGDLTTLGVRLTQQLDEWQEADAEIRPCFDSMTGLLQHVDPKPAFRFLDVLRRHLRAVDAVAHYHIEPDAHDERTIATLRPLFDAVIEFKDGTWSVKTR